MFDLLGSKEAMKGPDSEPFLQRIWKALREAAEFISDTKHPDWDPYAIKWFTDNLVLGWPFHFYHPGDTEPALGSTFIQTAYFQATLALEGMFGRGAITVGPMFMDDRIAFGPALLEAYELENEAKAPRVILSERAFELALNHVNYYFDVRDAPQNQEILVDGDGYPFISYLCPLLEDEDHSNAWRLLQQHAGILSDRLTNASREGVKRKYRWLAHYHNYFVDRYFPQAKKVKVGRSKPPALYSIEDLFRINDVPLRYPLERFP